MSPRLLLPKPSLPGQNDDADSTMYLSPPLTKWRPILSPLPGPQGCALLFPTHTHTHMLPQLPAIHHSIISPDATHTLFLSAPSLLRGTLNNFNDHDEGLTLASGFFKSHLSYPLSSPSAPVTGNGG